MNFQDLILHVCVCVGGECVCVQGEADKALESHSVSQQQESLRLD